MSARIHRRQVNTSVLAPGEYELVTFVWSREHGSCSDCGLPAAFYGVHAYGQGKHQKLCSVCAANAAADGQPIRRIYREDS